MNKNIVVGGANYFGSLIKARIRPTPLFVNLFYTRRCNLRCSFCSAIKHHAKKELTLKEWKECADILYEMGNRYISISGGEPLLRDDLTDFIHHLSKKSRLHSVVTNGTLLTENKLKELSQAGLMHLGLSTQSLMPGKHVKSQNTDLFDLILKYKNRYHFELSALVTITKDNVEEVPNIVEYLASKKINVAPNIVTSGKGNWWFRSNCPELLFDKSTMPKLKKTIKKIKTAKNILYSSQYLDSLVSYASGDRPLKCEAGKYYLSINDDGFVMPCQDLPPSAIHYRNLQTNYPLPNPKCDGCMWPCYYEENHNRTHPLDFLIKSARIATKI